MRITLLLLIAVILSGCASKQETANMSVEEYLAAIQSLEDDYYMYPEDKYDEVVCEKIKTWLKGIKDPKEIRRLFYICNEKKNERPEKSKDNMKWISPYFETNMTILYRLSEMRTTEATKVLVELYCDETLWWDTHPGETVLDAVIRCGDLALPFLKEKKKQSAKVDEPIKLIESGTKTIF